MTVAMVIATTRHAGNLYRDSYAYAEWTTWTRRGEHWERCYHAAGGFIYNFCPHNGGFGKCGLCSDPEAPMYVRVTAEELELEACMSLSQMTQYADATGTVTLDITGHEPVESAYGGCTLCWPSVGISSKELRAGND